MDMPQKRPTRVVGPYPNKPPKWLRDNFPNHEPKTYKQALEYTQDIKVLSEHSHLYVMNLLRDDQRSSAK